MPEMDTRFKFVMNELVLLSRKTRPERYSWQGVKNAVLLATSVLRSEALQNKAPIQLDKIKKIRMILEEKSFRGPSNGLDAILVPVPGGFVLKLNNRQGRSRRRFSTAHEIGHTFFYNLNTTTPTRWFPVTTSPLFSRKEEDICNAFARELLMPKELVQLDIANSGNKNLKMIIDLAAKYMVSPEVVARRLLLDLAMFESSIVLFKEPGVTNDKSVWWFYGTKLKRYIRKEEKAIFSQVIQAIREGCEPQSLCHMLASNKTMSIEHYQPRPNSRLMILVIFRRDNRFVLPN
ncbi:hypothetical protein ES703_38684 [subsurface metagenome]